MQSKFNIIKIIACLSTFTFGGAQALMIAFYPAIAESLGVDLAIVLYCVSVGTFLFIIGSPLWSNTNTYLTRYRVMHIGLAGLIISWLLVLLVMYYQSSNQTVNIALFLVSQILYGLIASATVPAAQAIQMQLVEVKQSIRASFIHNLCLNSGRVAGYAIVVFCYQYVTDVLISYAVWMILLYVMMLATRQREYIVSALPDLKRSWRSEIADIKWLILIAILYACYLETLILSLTTLIKQQFFVGTLFASGFSAKILLMLSVGMFVGQYLGKRIITESQHTGFIIGVISLFIGSLLLLNVTSVVSLWIALCVIVVGLGILPPLYLSLLRTADATYHYGRRVGIMAVAHTIGYSIGGVFAGIIINQNTVHIGACLSVIAIILILTYYKQWLFINCKPSTRMVLS
jgi:MFS family permease